MRVKMADNELLNSLQEIHDDCCDWETKRKLEVLINSIKQKQSICYD